MFQLAVHRGQLDPVPRFPKRLEENPPRQGFLEHDEHVKVRARRRASYRDVLDFAYYSPYRRSRAFDPSCRSPAALTELRHHGPQLYHVPGWKASAEKWNTFMNRPVKLPRWS